MYQMLPRSELMSRSDQPHIIKCIVSDTNSIWKIKLRQNNYSKIKFLVLAIHIHNFSNNFYQQL